MFSIRIFVIGMTLMSMLDLLVISVPMQLVVVFVLRDDDDSHYFDCSRNLQNDCLLMTFIIVVSCKKYKWNYLTMTTMDIGGNKFLCVFFNYEELGHLWYMKFEIIEVSSLNLFGIFSWIVIISFLHGSF